MRSRFEPQNPPGESVAQASRLLGRCGAAETAALRWVARRFMGRAGEEARNFQEQILSPRPSPLGRGEGDKNRVKMRSTDAAGRVFAGATQEGKAGTEGHLHQRLQRGNRRQRPHPDRGRGLPAKALLAAAVDQCGARLPGPARVNARAVPRGRRFAAIHLRPLC
jgi:hypothetical protein